MVLAKASEYPKCTADHRNSVYPVIHQLVDSIVLYMYIHVSDGKEFNTSKFQNIWVFYLTPFLALTTYCPRHA